MILSFFFFNTVFFFFFYISSSQHYSCQSGLWSCFLLLFSLSSDTCQTAAQQWGNSPALPREPWIVSSFPGLASRVFQDDDGTCEAAVRRFGFHLDTSAASGYTDPWASPGHLAELWSPSALPGAFPRQHMSHMMQTLHAFISKRLHMFCDDLNHLSAWLHCLFILFYCFCFMLLLLVVNHAGIKLINAETPCKRFSSRIEQRDIFAHFCLVTEAQTHQRKEKWK